MSIESLPWEIVLLRGWAHLHPDLVIVVMNSSDRNAPRWEWIYGVSYIFRHIIHDILNYNWMFVKKHSMETKVPQAAAMIPVAIEAFAQCAKQQKFALLIVVHPQKWEVLAGQYGQWFYEFQTKLKKDAEWYFLDLLEYYTAKKLITKENVAEFYWKKDSHHNTQGYEIMGTSIAEHIIELNLID